MSKKIMDLIPDSLHQQLRDEVIEDLKAKDFSDLKAKGFTVTKNQDLKNPTELDKDIQDWAKNSDKNDWSKKV